MKFLTALVFIGCMASVFAASYVINTVPTPTYAQEQDDRVILGHRIGPNGQSQLVYDN